MDIATGYMTYLRDIKHTVGLSLQQHQSVNVIKYGSFQIIIATIDIQVSIYYGLQSATTTTTTTQIKLLTLARCIFAQFTQLDAHRHHAQQLASCLIYS